MRRSVCLVAGLLLVQGCAFLGSDALDARMDVDFDGHIAEQFGGDDCDDQNPAIYAGALEIWYDGIDGNCDDWSDFDQDGDGLDSVEHGGVDCDDFDSQVGDHRVWYADEDQDGFGSLVESVQACEAPRNHLAWAEDCDDTNADNHPGADEWCDGVDNDCDGETDEDDAVDALIWYRDADEDGYGDPESTIFACSVPEGYLEDDRDCGDSDETVNPDGSEECNDGVDNNCDGKTNQCILQGLSYVDLSANATLVPEGTGQLFGWWVGNGGDLNNDGLDELLISAPWADNGGLTQAGAAYVWLGRNDESSPQPFETMTLSTSTADVVIEGTQKQWLLGTSAAAIGDHNADGYDDVAISNCSITTSSFGTSETSEILIVEGGEDWGSAEVMETTRITGVAGAYHPKLSVWFGCGLAPLGDINGDGYSDLLVGSPGTSFVLTEDGDTGDTRDTGDTGIGGGDDSTDDGGISLEGEDWGKVSQGLVYLMLGPFDSEPNVEEAYLTLYGSASFGTDTTGRTLTGGGDMNGDGIPDFATSTMAGETTAGYGSGSVYLYYGEPPSGFMAMTDSADVTLTGDGYYAMAGEGVEIQGDFNGDGYSDLVISSPRYSDDKGAAYVQYGSASELVGTYSLFSADYKVFGTQPEDEVGVNVATAGDLNGDGSDELMIGATGKYPSERIFLFYGPLPTSGTQDVNTAEGRFSLTADFSVSDYVMDRSGHISMGSAGNFNGDTYSEMVIGYPFFNPSATGGEERTEDGRAFFYVGLGY